MSSYPVVVYMKDQSARSFVTAIQYLDRFVRVRLNGRKITNLYGDFFSSHLDQSVFGVVRAEMGIEFQAAPPHMHWLNGYAEGFIRILKIATRVRLANLIGKYIDGELIRLDEAKRLDKYFNHDISVLVDRVKIKKTPGRRLPQSVEAALKLTGGTLDVKFNDKIQNYSQNLGCLECGTSYDKLEPRDFSFNSPFGACNTCNGLGINY